MDDRKMDDTIAAILRTGVSVAAVLVVIGAAIYLRDVGNMRPAYGTFRAAKYRPGLMEAGLLLLILTPVARVVFSIYAFAIEKDSMYVGITLVVLALLAVGWFT